jgi:hypothetical protein
MSKFAANTEVPVDRSRAELEKILEKYGASQFIYGTEKNRVVIGFSMHDRMVRFNIPMPDKTDKEITTYKTGWQTKTRTAGAIEEKFNQAMRQRWRALVLVIKAKLEASESGITDFETEFLSHIILPDGSTVGQWAKPQIQKAYTAGNMPQLLPGSSG